MSRLSAVGSVPIADRIKVFDTGGGSKPRTNRGKVTPSSSPLPQAKLPPTPLTNLPKSSSGISLSQYSAKDPTSGRQSGTSTPSRSSSRSSLTSDLGSGPNSLKGVARAGGGDNSTHSGNQNTTAKSSQPGPNMNKPSPSSYQYNHNSRAGSEVASKENSLTLKDRSNSISEVKTSKKYSGFSTNSVSSNRTSSVTSETSSLGTVVLTPESSKSKWSVSSANESGNVEGIDIFSPDAAVTAKENSSFDSVYSLNSKLSTGNHDRKIGTDVTPVKRAVDKRYGVDAVDRGIVRKSSSSEVIIAEHVKPKEKQVPAGDHSSMNNNVTDHRNANDINNANHWSNGTSTTPTSGGREEKLSSINSIHSITSSCEELPSFSSSVTEEMDLVLGGLGSSRQGRTSGGPVSHRESDLEDQVVELTQQVEMLFKAKQRIEADMASLKREHKREMADKEDELEDARMSASKKVKMMELQLEQEHEERLSLVRDRHEMEGKIIGLKDAIEHGQGEDQVRRLKKELRKNKALLRDAQVMLDKQSGEGMNKIVLRQLKNQLEDAEFARTAAMKARQNCELELADVQTQLEDVSRAKSEMEERCVQLGREKGSLVSQLKENEEEMAELIKKYKASVAAGSTDQITIQDQAVTIQQLEVERNRAREQLAEMEQRVEHMKGESVSVAAHRRLELKQREMENKLELERTGKSRLETQVARLREALEKAGREAEQLRVKERQQTEEARKANKALREVKEENSTLQGREAEWAQRRIDLERQLELSEAEIVTVKGDLKLASRRVEDLQAAIQGDMDSETDFNLTSDCEGGIDSDDDDLFKTRKAIRSVPSTSSEKPNSSLQDTPHSDF